MAEIYEIRKKHARLFTDLDPYGFAGLSGFGDIHTFVAVEPFVKGDYPAGICTVSLSDEDAYVLWLYIREEYRTMGIGEVFLEKVCDIAGEFGADKVHVLIPGSPDTEGLPINLEYYFYERGFKKNAPGFFEFWLDADMVGNITDNVVNSMGDVVSIDSMTPKQMEKLGSATEMNYGLSFEDMSYDKEASCACFDKEGQPIAATLFVEANGTWLLAGSLSKDPEAAKKVLGFGLADIAERMEMKNSVHLIGSGKVLNEAVGSLSGGIQAGKVNDLMFKL